MRSDMETDPERWDIGTGVSGYVWRAETPRAALLLQHGYGEYAGRFVTQYAGLVPRLVDLGINVFAFDMRGHGNSPGERGIVDVRQTVSDHLAARYRLAASGLPIYLLGHSLGGLVTATSVLDDPGGLAGVVLSSPALLIRGSFVQRQFLGLLAQLAPSRAAVPQGSPGRNTRRREIVEQSARDPLTYRGPLPMILASSAMTASARNRRRYSSWRAPVLVLHGTDDSATDAAGSECFVNRVAAADRTLRLFPGGRHELLNDLVADEAMAEILGWISSRVGPLNPERAKFAFGGGA